MRRQKSLALVTLTAFAVLALASPASASEESVGSCIAEELASVGVEHFEEIEHEVAGGNASEEVVAELEAIEKDFERCVEAPSPIIPEVNEIIWGGAAFLVLFGLMAWKLFPAVKDGMDARADKIRDYLAAADKAKADAQAEHAAYTAKLGDAKAEAAQIVDDAREQANLVRADLQSRAEADIAEARQQAAAEVETTKAQAMLDLRGEVSDIALGAAELVIGSTLDRAAHTSLIDDYIDQVGSRS
jgi:F-type H+-transporting ATPase subunit b